MGNAIHDSFDALKGAMTQNIKSFTLATPQIYAYNTPGITYHNGWTKIGYTEQEVHDRIRQQTHTADVRYSLLWYDPAFDKKGHHFWDHDFHAYLVSKKHVQRKSQTEWFHIDGDTSHAYFREFVNDKQESQQRCTYILRKEQAQAVSMAKSYFENGGTEFLWNAKPRFGKTLSAYDLICQMKLRNVLVVTNRPSISHSWADDFFKFIGWQNPYCFVSDAKFMRDDKRVLTRDSYVNQALENGFEKGMIAFESLQGLKGSVYFGGKYNKLRWIRDMNFDLLIVDESQEGVDTFKTEKAFEQIKRKYTLYLSGTPFKQLASGQFNDNQVFNWTYVDEQKAKKEWSAYSDDYNPYEVLPDMAMFTYQMSPMIYDEVSQGIDLSGEGNVDFAFDLNEFFKVDSKKEFVHLVQVKKFLHSLATNEKYPFSTPKLRKELSHTLWLLDRVDSALALKKLLEEDPIFKDYYIIDAVGPKHKDLNPGDDEGADEAAKDNLARVKEAIKNHPKTITLSVGQLTVGVTIKQWSGVLMLCNMKSASLYVQAAFRAQNPCEFKDKDGNFWRKKTSYVFDFDPARTLLIFDEFANNVYSDTAGGSGTKEERAKHIKQLLNFFPVIGEDEDGKMVELNAGQVLSIPRKLKSEEVVNHGFMSNFLFANISNIFHAPEAVQNILQKLKAVKKDELNVPDSVNVDENGEAVPDGEKVIGTAAGLFGEERKIDLGPDVQQHLEDLQKKAEVKSKPGSSVNKELNKIRDTIKTEVRNKIIQPVVDSHGNISKSTQHHVEKVINQHIEREFENIRSDFNREANIAQAELNQKQEQIRKDVRENKKTQMEAERAFAQAKQEAEEKTAGAYRQLQEEVTNLVQETETQVPTEVVKAVQQQEDQKVVNDTEEKVREHLRGFAQAVPSFIMAYGDRGLKLSNLDEYTDDKVFQEVTGITEEEFRFLRDGGDYTNPDGTTEHFAGHLFDEVVFDDAVQAFLDKKEKLANYFDENQKQDIFDYIPPQQTNQIFTPKRVVKKMVDMLEKENPGCFDNPDSTFADLYMKSGMYITEIVKRLYKSEHMKALYPDKVERLNHIFSTQVYGCAPTEILYRICRRYILGFSQNVHIEKDNIRKFDALPYAKNGTLEKELDKVFGVTQ